MKTAIVCEGGGMRGIYTAGVLQSWMDEGFAANELIGVSAGASTGISYVSGQSGRMRRTYINYCKDSRYVSVRNYLRTGSLFGMDFIFGEIPNKLDPFDQESFNSSKCEYYAGATNAQTGEIEYFGKSDLDENFSMLRASCSLPVLSPFQQLDGVNYSDGGVAAPIPFAKALEDGCDKMLIVLTQPRDYVKKPSKSGAIYRAIYKDYPAFAEALINRHLVYAQQQAQISQLEAEGKAIIVAPATSLAAGRTTTDKLKLMTSYQVGMQDGLAALKKL